MRKGDRALRVLVPIAAMLLLQCSGDDSSGPTVETYNVTATPGSAEFFGDGSFVQTYGLRVTDNGGTRIQGATIRLEASAGTVSPASTTSGVGGVAEVEWTVTGSERAGQSRVTLSACAQNQQPADCTPQEIAAVNSAAAVAP